MNPTIALAFVPSLALALTACGCVHPPERAPTKPRTTPPVVQKTGVAALASARRAGIRERVDGWSISRYVSGEHAHFLYVRGQETFSLFLTPTDRKTPPEPRAGWESVTIKSDERALLHRDNRPPSRSAILWWHDSERRMLVGNLTPAQLTDLAEKID